MESEKKEMTQEQALKLYEKAEQKVIARLDDKYLAEYPVSASQFVAEKTGEELTAMGYDANDVIDTMRGQA